MRSIHLLMVVVILASIFLSSCTTAPPNPLPGDLSCTADSNCVPKECCHPTSCINQNSKGVCNLACTEECKPGTLDCGQGSCQCINGQCSAVMKQASEQSCSADSDCVPKECCHPTSCINQAYKGVCNLACTEECKPGTMDCGQGSCRCVKGSCTAEMG